MTFNVAVLRLFWCGDAW